MSKYWNKKINDAEPYVAGEQPKEGQKIIKLNTNENPYAPSPKVAEALAQFDISELRLYPNTDGGELVQAIADREGVKPSQVFCGNGSDEVLAICFQTFFEKDGITDLPVLTPEFSYSFYPVYESFYDLRSKKIPLREDFRLEKTDYEGVPNCGIAIANPNAPTSRAISLDDISYICEKNPDSVVIIDEAYAYFAEPYETAVSLLDKYPNLCVVRTTSKSYSLAGLRIGYAIASEELIEGLKRARDSFNSYPTDRLAQKVAAAAISDEEYHKECRAKIIATRKYTEDALKALGFTMPESSANFVFAKPPAGVDAGLLYKNLREKGILVRYFDKDVLRDYLRITIGTDEEMRALVEACTEEIKNVQNS